MGAELGLRIKNIRKKRGITQEALAQEVGIAHQTLNKYEKGHRSPDSETLNQMAKALQCDPGWLLSGEGSPERAGAEERVTPDLELMADSIREIAEVFEAEDLHLPPEKFARLVILYYRDRLKDRGRKPDRGRIVELVRLAS